jgi:3-deoxy-D-manno-octulosonic-acid transferase
MHIVYSAVAAAVLALSAPWWIWRMLRSGNYRAGIAERLGRVPIRLRTAETSSRDTCVWVHAVSVGEVLAASGVIAELRKRFPEQRVVVSTTTLAAQTLARERFGDANVFYFPLDFAIAIRPYLRTLRPELVVLAETEFWPNFLRLAKRSGARIAVVNARISDRSLPRYRRWRGLMRHVLANIDVFLAQSDEDRRRLIEIGAAAERVSVGGNLKFDVKPPASLPIVQELRAALTRGGASHVLICGSTVLGEEEVLLRVFRALLQPHPQAVMILAPRHPERFAAVADLLQASGIPCWRRSDVPRDASLAGGVLLLDTIGELSAIYALGSVTFVGGSLVPSGGHNIVEPAQHGVPVLVGPHTQNFRDIVNIFQRAHALRIVTEETLVPTLLELFGNETLRRDLGGRAAQVVASQSGAAERTLAALSALLAPRASSIPSEAMPHSSVVRDVSATR